MKKLFLSVLILSAVVLTGCAGGSADGGSAKIDSDFGSVESTSNDMGRFTAWAKGEVKKGEVVKEMEKTEQKRLDLKIAEANSTKIVLDTPEKILIYANVKLTENMAEALKAMAGADKAKYAAYLQPTAMPKSAFAEGTEAVGGVITGAAQTPAVMTTSTGYAFGRFIGGVKGGTTVSASNGARVSVNQAAASGQSKANINNGGTSKGEEKTEVNPMHWSECNTTAKGQATVDEINACMQGYGYSTYVQGGQIYLDGVPYSGV